MPQIEFFDDTHTYLVDGVEYPSVTQVLTYLSRGYAGVNPSVLEYAKRRGSLVHELTESIDEGISPYDLDVPPEVLGNLRAYMDFVQDFMPENIYIEKKLYNAEFGFCGTVDRVIQHRDEIWVLDIKNIATPTKANKISVCCQTAAYELCLDLDKEPFKGKPVRHKALYLNKNGEYKLFDCADFEKKYNFSGKVLFLQCLELYKEIERI